MDNNLSKIREALRLQQKQKWFGTFDQWKKRVAAADEAITLLTELEQSQVLVEVVTVEEFAERMLHKVVLDGQYSMCYGRDISKEYPNGIKIISGEGA